MTTVDGDLTWDNERSKNLNKIKIDVKLNKNIIWTILDERMGLVCLQLIFCLLNRGENLIFFLLSAQSDFMRKF